MGQRDERRRNARAGGGGMARHGGGNVTPIGSIVSTGYGVAIVLASTPWMASIEGELDDEWIDARLICDIDGYRIISFLLRASIGTLNRIH